jgi:hypothetical protein
MELREIDEINEINWSLSSARVSRINVSGSVLFGVESAHS